MSGRRGNAAAAILSGILLMPIGLAGCAPPPPLQVAAPASAPVRAAPEPAPKAAPDSRAAFQSIAAELLLNLAPGKRIAIQPFRPADLPVAPPVAQGFNDALARAIEASPEGNAIIVAREELPRLFGEAEEFGEASGAQRLLESVRADVLMIGTVTAVRGGVDVSYKAFDARTGHQIATATPRFMAVDLTVPTGLALGQALAVAADALAREAPDLNAVQSLGITYQQSETETALGLYIGREIVGRLREKVGARSATPAALLRPEGERADRQPADRQPADGERMVRGQPGAYLLSGTLWDLGQDFEVRLSLQGTGERAVSHGMRIRRDTIPTGLLAAASAPPPLPSRERRESHATTLVLSSDRGQRPVYAVGDAARLMVQAGRDGYLYCFHQASPAAGGGITKIFPNPYHADARVQGGHDVHIPEPGMGFALRVFGPAGIEYVRCFASDRDLAAGLAPGILGRDLEPVGVHSLDDLSRIFRNLPAANVADATLVMTVTARDAGRNDTRAAGVRPAAKNAP